MKKNLIVLLLCLTVASLVSADYYLVEPTGEMRRAEKTEKGWESADGQPVHSEGFGPGFIDTVWFHDPDIQGWYYPDRDSNTVALQYFQSEYACSLVAVGIDYYSAGWADFYIWEAPDPFPTTTYAESLYFVDNWSYNDATDNWDTWPTVLYQGSIGSDDPPDDNFQRTCWIDIVPKLDVGTNYVFVGYRIITQGALVSPYGGRPWPLSDGWVDPSGRDYHWTPCRTWMFRVQSNSSLHLQWTPYGDITGDWEFYYIIDIYANAPPSVRSYDQILGSYDLSARPITATITDFGVPAESSGVDEAWLFYYLNDDLGTLDSLPMTLTSGTITEGTWEATIPAQTANTEVTYYFKTLDIQGLGAISDPSWSYYLGQGHPDHVFFHIGVLNDYEAHDPVHAVRSQVDVWDEGERGVADSSVFEYYITGPGEKGIIYLDWTGTTMLEDTAYFRRFLDAGGSLLISSQDLPADFGLADDPNNPYGHWTANPIAHPFAYNYLQLRSGTDDYDDIDTLATFLAFGIPGDPITGTLDQQYISPSSNWTGIFDSVAAGGSEIFYGPSFEIIGYRWEGSYKLVFLYWHFDEIGDTTGGFTPDTAAQNEFMRNALGWLDLTVGVDEMVKPDVAGAYSLFQNVPNPVRTGRTSIRYSLPRTEEVSLKVYDITGSLVDVLVDEEVPAGIHTAEFAMDNLAAGVYFYRLEAGEFSATRKIISLR